MDIYKYYLLISSIIKFLMNGSLSFIKYIWFISSYVHSSINNTQIFCHINALFFEKTILFINSISSPFLCYSLLK